MIVPITGNVTYAITLDPTVWIFDDRKILLEDAFSINTDPETEIDEAEKVAKRWERAVYPQYMKPPVNKSISRHEGEKFLKNSYVMPLIDFIENAELKPDASIATLVTKDIDKQISLSELKDGYLQFAHHGKPLKDDGPVYFYFNDGSNKETPIRNVCKIIIN
jgi:hypothetical protein